MDSIRNHIKQHPWLWKNGEFSGERVNDIHLTNEEKRESQGYNKKWLREFKASRVSAGEVNQKF